MSEIDIESQTISQFQVVADDKRPQTEFVIGDPVKPTATIVVKAREELPRYEALGTNPVTHLGESPRLIPEAEQTYQEWVGYVSSGERRGSPYYVVDATPLGAIELALRFKEDERLQKIAEEIRNGIYSPEAIAIIDMYSAALFADPNALDAVNESAQNWRRQNKELDDKMFLLYNAFISGEVHPSLEGTPELEEALKLREVYPEVKEIAQPFVEELQTMLRNLHEQGRVGEFARELELRTRDQNDITFRVTQAITGLVNDHRESRDTIERDTREVGLTREPNPQAVITLAKALAGDKLANDEISRALEVVAARDQFALERTQLGNSRRLFMKQERNPISKDELVLVHATLFEPKFDESGAALIHTRGDTQGYPRATLHFTLNHKVVGHMQGNWDEAGYTIVAPFNPAVQANGLPANLCGIDTWWNQNPGEPVRLPGAILVKDAGNIEQLVSRQGNIVEVKTSGFTSADVEQLFDQALDQKDFGPFIDCLTETEEAREANTELLELFNRAIKSGSYSSSIDHAVVDEIRLRLGEIDLSSQHVVGTLAQFNQQNTIKEVIRGLDGPILSGGMWATSREDAIRDVAADHRISSVAHMGTGEEVTESIGRESFLGKPTGPLPSLKDTPIEARRALVNSGVITMAGPAPIEREFDNGFSPI